MAAFLLAAAVAMAAREALLPAIEREAAAAHVPPALADAVAAIESGYDSGALGSAGEVGLMQVLPATAAQLGFRGAVSGLFDPATNLHLGVAYLARAWAASGGAPCRALMKYRAGLGEAAYSPRSLAYCARARLWLASIGSPLAARIPEGLPLTPAPSPLRHLDLASIGALAGLPVRLAQPWSGAGPAQAAAAAIASALAE